MLHLAIITYLCIKGGVTFNKYEEKRCPTTPSLKPPSNKGKEKLNEVEEEIRERVKELDDSNPDEQALVVSTEKRKHAR